MVEPSPPPTLRHHLEQLATEASEVQPIVFHSCEYCIQLLVKFPDVYPFHIEGLQEPVYASITGLSSSSMLSAARNGCLLFEQWLHKVKKEPTIKDLDNKLFLKIYFDYSTNRMHSSDYPSTDVWNVYLTSSYTISRPFALGIGEDSKVPFWLRKNRIWRSSPATDEAFRTARGWLEQCHQHTLQAVPEGTTNLHKRCKLVPNNFVPSRLVCVPEFDATSLQIVETKGFGYVTWCSLSYCWGGPQEIQTTSNNFGDGRRTIRISDLPRTISDAVLVVRNLDVCYIWIDSLCIIQDDPTDMQKELANMAKIYEQSVVTLVAAAASAVSEGFLGPRNLSNAWIRPPIQLRCQSESGTIGHILLHSLSPNKYVSPLDMRGWALQERLLSPRTLIYGTKTLRWSCLSQSYRDSGLQYWESSNVASISRGAALFEVMGIWSIVVEQYTERRLTFDDDKLIALAAVAERYSSQNHRVYLAGLWRDDISYMWIWYYKTTSGNHRPKTFRAPSWSWASVNSEHPVKFGSPHFATFNIIEIEVIPRIPTIPYGDAKSGFMVVECKIAWFFLKRDKEIFQPYLTVKEEDNRNPFKDSDYFVVLDAPNDDFMSWNSPGKIVYRVWMLLSGDDYGMLLKKVRGKTDTYSRVGACKVSSFWKDQDGLLSIFNRTKPRTIIIQ